MKISPITDNNMQHRNISTKAEMSYIVRDMCEKQKLLWNKMDGLLESDAEMFEGKTIKEKWQIRGEYRKKAEKNFKLLKRLIKGKFSSDGFFEIKKSPEDNKQHASIRSLLNSYVYDFGPLELSENNNSLTDIDKISELIEKIKSLSRRDRSSINYKLEHRQSNGDQDDDIIGSMIICCAMAGGM